ncbi:MAG: mercuric transporter MerT family protein [Betaproteobacteria bacterium]
MSQSKVAMGSVAASTSTDDAPGTKTGSLAVAGIAGVFASACCLGPLVLASIGLGGIAAGVVAMFEPLRAVFMVIAVSALAFAGWKIYRRPAGACGPGNVCVPARGRTYKALFWVTVPVVLALITFPYYAGLFY